MYNAIALCKFNAAFRVNVAFLYSQELTAAEEEQVEEDKEKQHQVSQEAFTC